MTLRDTLFELLTEDATLIGLIPVESWYWTDAVDDAPPLPFAVLRLSGTFPGMGSVKRVRFEAKIHDARGSLSLQDAVIRRINELLDSAEHIQGAPGVEIITCEWLSDSPDLFDEGYKSGMKSTSHDIIGRGI